MQSLFPVSSGASGGRSDGSISLVKFKAGQCDMVGPDSDGNYNCTPNVRRGEISLVRTPDNLIHFRWSDRTSHTNEIDRIVFPNDAKFRKINTGKDDDRVYLLKLDGSQMMFWMQDKSSDKDEEVINKTNEFINNPAAAQAAANEASAATGTSGDSAMSPEAWMQSLGLGPFGAPAQGGQAANAPPAPPAVAAATTTTTSNPPLAPSTTTGTDGNSTTTTTQPLISAEALRMAVGSAMSQQRVEPLELQQIVNGDSVLNTGILEDEEVVNILLNELPESQRNRQQLELAIRSPQLADAMRAVSRALQGDNYLAVMANFGIDATPGFPELNRGETVLAFLTAIMSANPPSNNDNNDNDNNAE